MPDLLPLGLSFDPVAASAIAWDGGNSVILANPEWLRREPEAAAAACRLLPTLDGHFWIATSGSSSAVPGQTRWVALSRDAVLASAGAVNRHLSSSASDVWVHALPLFHVGGLGILARAHLSGAQVASGGAGRWDASTFRALARESRATLTALVPSQVHDLVRANIEAPPELRAAVIGGARLDPTLYHEARSLGWPCLPSYGLTETASQVATAALASRHRATFPSVLPLLDHAEARIGDEGRLDIRASSLLTCCAEIVEGRTRIWDPKHDGWFGTGDLGVVHPEGIEIRGRLTDSVKVLGEAVSLERIEEAAKRWAEREPLLAGHQLDLAVAALPHQRLGRELVLALAGRNSAGLDPAVLLASIDRFFAETMLPYERLRRVVWLSGIPRTALGKCQRQLLTDALMPPSMPRGGP